MRIGILSVIAILLSFYACNSPTGVKSYYKGYSDTLEVPYTYWWLSGGPFTGLCGDPYSLVFTGTVRKLDQSGTPEMNYTPQTGIIKINHIKFKRPPTETIESNKEFPQYGYKNQSYFKSDCFHDSGLKKGDKVIVFVYSYESKYSIPGKSILKVDSFNDPIILSIENYIKSGQNPLSIQGDTLIWQKYNLDHNLKQIIGCKVTLRNKK